MKTSEGDEEPHADGFHNKLCNRSLFSLALHNMHVTVVGVVEVEGGLHSIFSRWHPLSGLGGRSTTRLLVLLPVLLLAGRRAVERLQASAAGQQLDIRRSFLLAARALRGVPGEFFCHRSVTLSRGYFYWGAPCRLLVHVRAQFVQQLGCLFMTVSSRCMQRSLASLASGIYVRSQLAEHTNRLGVTCLSRCKHRSVATFVRGVDASPQLTECTNSLDVTFLGRCPHRNVASLVSGVDISPQLAEGTNSFGVATAVQP
jgi:hypothetical protein